MKFIVLSNTSFWIDWFSFFVSSNWSTIFSIFSLILSTFGSFSSKGGISIFCKLTFILISLILSPILFALVFNSLHIWIIVLAKSLLSLSLPSLVFFSIWSSCAWLWLINSVILLRGNNKRSVNFLIFSLSSRFSISGCIMHWKKK